jgi:hypothetical protein
MSSDPTPYWPDAGRGPLPLVVGVAGHRDLRPDDRDGLEKCVRRILTQLQRRYRHTPLVLLSSLAEGADRLVARVALELGARLVVPLPMPADLYREDFKSDESRAEFKNLLDRAERVFVVPYFEDNTAENLADPERRGRQYALAGAAVVRQSQVLLALWDGVEAKREGGTAAVVAFRRAGVPGRYSPGADLLDPVGCGPLCHVVTPRLSNPRPSGRPLTWNRDYLRGRSQALGRLNDFNRDACRLGARLQAQRESNMEGALPAGDLLALPDGRRATATALRAWYGLADTLALHFQARARRALVALFTLAFFTACCFKIAYWLPDEDWARLAYKVLGGLLILLSSWVWYRGYHRKHLACRALAEGLRVRLFWRLGGVAEAVPDHSLRIQRRGLEWVDLAIRNGALVVEGGDGAEGSPACLALVLRHWVQGQRDYFRRAAARDRRLHRVLHWGRWAALFVGGLWMAASLVATVTAWFPPPAAWVGDRLALAQDARRALRLADVAVGVGLFLVGGMLLAFARVRGLAEDAERYRQMFEIFNSACLLLEGAAAGDIGEVQKILLKLGQDALVETGDWVRKHEAAPVMAPTP